MTAADIAGRALIPVAIAIVLGLSRRYLRSSGTVRFTAADAIEFSKLQWAVGAGMLVAGSLFGFFAYHLFVWANGSLLFSSVNMPFVLLPSHWIWFFAPFFGAICLAWEMVLGVWRLVGDRSKARRYESWSNAKAGFDATRVLRIFTLVIGLPILIATILALPIHTSLGQTGMRIGHFAQLRPTEYSYSEIRAITVTTGLRLRDGSLQKRPAIVLDFADGTRWSSANDRDPERAIDEPLLNFIRERTNLAIRYIEAFPFGSA